MRSACLVLFVCLAACAAAIPASAAGPHLEPGTLVAGDTPDHGDVVLLYVQSGFKESQAVYMVRPVIRCRDPAGPGWYAPASVHELRSAPELEGRQRLGTLNPAAIPAVCADPVPAPLPPARARIWDRLVDGTLDPFGPVAFPPFGLLNGTVTDDGAVSGNEGDRLVEEAYRPPIAGA